MNNIDKALNNLSPDIRRAISQEFKKLNDEINSLKNANVVLTPQLLKEIRDVAKREALYYGASTIGTWKIKDLIRVEEGDKKQTTDIIIYTGGELVIRGEVVIV